MTDKRKFDEVDDQETLSLQDVINEDDELQETANAVLGGSDDKKCTYSEGYVKRQALFACSTCCSPSDPPAGICLACSLHCHDGHKLYEIYTKRLFCCDCGNAKFPNFACKLEPQKENYNKNNCYNQNFYGLYCTCSRPYPDEDDEVEDIMIQCVICEDWFHGRHLGKTSVPSETEFDEMICSGCMQKCPILRKYSSIYVAPIQVSHALEKEVDVETTASTTKPTSQLKTKTICDGEEPASDRIGDFVSVLNPKKGADHEAHSSSHDVAIPSSSNQEDMCKVKFLKSADVVGAVFWPNQWRDVLCKCKNCICEYEKENISFLLDKADTVKAYEDKGRAKVYDVAAESRIVLGNMPRIQQVELIQGYNDMKGDLAEYLRTFADEGKVVTADDITTFFQRLRNKRQKTSIQYNCH